jgi:hypothetical protein
MTWVFTDGMSRSLCEDRLRCGSLGSNRSYMINGIIHDHRSVIGDQQMEFESPGHAPRSAEYTRGPSVDCLVMSQVKVACRATRVTLVSPPLASLSLLPSSVSVFSVVSVVSVSLSLCLCLLFFFSILSSPLSSVSSLSYVYLVYHLSLSLLRCDSVGGNSVSGHSVGGNSVGGNSVDGIFRLESASSHIMVNLFSAVVSLPPSSGPLQGKSLYVFV